MTDRFLPYGRQSIDDSDIKAVADALTGDFLTTGPLVDEFEQAFADYVGSDYAVACSNGTASLHLLMLALDIGPGDVCIVPSITFLATANCARYVGADVVFADVDPQSGLMTPQLAREAVERAGGQRPVRAILPVHLRGDACDLPGLAQVASEVGAVLVEDAPHALGTRTLFDGKPGRIGDCRYGMAASFSFHPVKSLTTGEGGMITTSDAALAQKLRRLRSHGMTRPADADPWVYEMQAPGFNYRLPDINCALGLSQLKRMERFADRRRHLAALYVKAFAGMTDRVVAAPCSSQADPALHLLTVLIDYAARGTSRRAVMDALKADGIGTQVHYIPVHQQPYYRSLYGDLDLPGAQMWYDRCLTLPLFVDMTDEEVDRVVESLSKLI